MKTIKFSIIVPVYNVELYLCECLDSIVNQTYKNIEIIVINDGSTDNSLNIIKQYQKDDKRVILIDQKNQGLSIARNNGIQAATGDYLLFIDSDDYIDTRTCEYIMQNINEQGDSVDIVMFGRYRFSDLGHRYDYESPGDYCGIMTGEDYFIRSMTDESFNVSSCDKAFRLEFLKNSNLSFPPNLLYEDLLFVFRATMMAKKVSVLDKPLYYYRIAREGSITNVIKDRDVEILIILKKLEETMLELHSSTTIREIFPKFVFPRISLNICIKYMRQKPFSRKANMISRRVTYDPIYYKYIQIIKNDKSAPFSWRVLCYLSIYYPLLVIVVYVHGIISKIYKH